VERQHLTLEVVSGRATQPREAVCVSPGQAPLVQSLLVQTLGEVLSASPDLGDHILRVSSHVATQLFDGELHTKEGILQLDP
jgi:hypothetical protein